MVGACGLAGCSPALPTYPAMEPAAALLVISDRVESVRTVSARCDVVLTDATGDSIRLDGALAASLPHRLRLRAWKFDRAVFDLTLVDGEAWLVAPEGEGMGDRSGAARELPAAQIGAALSLLGPEYFAVARAVPGASDEHRLTVAGPALGRDEVVCEIQRRTLTPSRYIVPGSAAPAGEVPVDDGAELSLDRYRTIDGVVWPTRIRLRGKDGEVVIRLGDVELNGELPAAAFTPPRRATKLP